MVILLNKLVNRDHDYHIMILMMVIYSDGSMIVIKYGIYDAHLIVVMVMLWFYDFYKYYVYGMLYCIIMIVISVYGFMCFLIVISVGKIIVI